MSTKLAVAINFAKFLCNLVMPASILGTFGLEIAHDWTEHVKEDTERSMLRRLGGREDRTGKLRI